LSVLKEFKEFAGKGAVMDLAVGVIIGAAFGKVVDSIVRDLIMPIVGAIFGKLDFSNMFIILSNVPAGMGSTLEAQEKPVLRHLLMATSSRWRSIL